MATSLKDLDEQLAALSSAEKAEVVRRLALEVVNTWPGIEKTPGIMGGSACVVRTRISVWMLVSYRRRGLTEAGILEAYPALRALDLANAWAYADAHRDEIERDIRENEAA